MMTKFEILAGLNEKQHRWILEHLPIRAENISGLSAVHNCKITEVKLEVTFAMFYARYNVKRNKIRAERLWNRMSEADRIRAWYFIQTYQTRLEPGVQPMYPETYLNAQPWND